MQMKSHLHICLAEAGAWFCISTMPLDEGGVASAPPEEAATLGQLSAHLLLHVLCFQHAVAFCQYGIAVTRIRPQAMAYWS